ncbi:hypothetical protein V6N13_124799 [Hibiscus sabdariffa]|uniref:Uncharacterized protein n=1 Tax=Hibiscus sabdariffa TaxID=183260 RepID=A0ABR2U428_9ROSI
METPTFSTKVTKSQAWLLSSSTTASLFADQELEKIEWKTRRRNGKQQEERGQVKTLVQKAEEEAEQSRIPLESRPFAHLQREMGDDYYEEDELR